MPPIGVGALPERASPVAALPERVFPVGALSERPPTEVEGRSESAPTMAICHFPHSAIGRGGHLPFPAPGFRYNTIHAQVWGG